MPTIAPMVYPKELLNVHEKVVVDQHPHWLYFIEPFLSAVAALVLLILFYSWTGGFADFMVKVMWVVIIGLAVWALVRVIKWRTVDFVVTSDRVIFREGLFAKRGIEIPLGRVNNVNFRQGILERICGAGNLMIESGGEDGQSHFTDIRQPQEVQRIIHDQIDASLRRAGSGGVAGSSVTLPPPAATAPTPAAPLSVADELEKLEGLKARGTITAEQFEAQKQKLLGG
jgi:membrane protein YdbS with pleckstrin-like domain